MASRESERNRQKNGEGPHSPTSLLMRVVLLAVWVAMVDLWLTRHFHSVVSAKVLSMLLDVPLGTVLSLHL